MAPDQESRITLRPASADDTCASWRRAMAVPMGPVLRDAGRDLAQQAHLLLMQWNLAEIRIIRAARRDIGWVQVAGVPDTLFVRNFSIDPAWQKLGIGAAVLRMVIAEASERGEAVSLSVAKGNPARRLYERFGFRITHDDGQHDYMRRDP